MEIDHVLSQSRSNKHVNSMWIKLSKSWESLQNVQSLCNQVGEVDISSSFASVQEEALSILNTLYENNSESLLNSNLSASEINDVLGKIHLDNFDKHIDYFDNLMKHLNAHSENNPSDLFYGFQLNTTNQIKNDLEKLDDFVACSQIIKNPMTPKHFNEEPSLCKEFIYDDHEFFQNIVGETINKINSHKKSLNLEQSSLSNVMNLRSHKDRILDYRVHTKIRNFEVATPKSNVLLEEIRDGTIANLFQSSAKK